ncbi:MAG: ABC transporter permease subunit, partial [Actinomycetota bacterium]
VPFFDQFKALYADPIGRCLVGWTLLAGLGAATERIRVGPFVLGMTYRQRMRRVVLPQAVRVIIPPTGNEFIAMIKDTALVSFIASTIGWYEIFKRAQVVGTQDFRNMEAFLLVAGMYWILTIIFTFFQARLERRMSKGYVREEIEKVKAAGHGATTVPGPAAVDEGALRIEGGGRT